MKQEETYQQLMLNDQVEAEKIIGQWNDSYRAGRPMIDDVMYDCVKESYAKKFPNNAAFDDSEIESDLTVIKGKTVELPKRMLSTHKAYSIAEIEKWADGVIKVAEEFGFGEQDTFFKVTPKLDGFAAYDDGVILYTRGDGRNGVDITRVINRGLNVQGHRRGQGPGEIIVDKKYFEDNLSQLFENTRNVLGAVIKEGELDKEINDAVKLGGISFMPFSAFNAWLLNKDDLMRRLEEIWVDVTKCPFDTDGLVIESVNESVKAKMGHTNHHHRWQIAYKKNTEYHDIKVTGLVWQTSKNGRLTPVVQLEPTKVSGVTISKATGHHYGNIIDKGIGVGAVVRVCRSGLVIPYIESVITCAPGWSVKRPTSCPSCGEPTWIDEDDLRCSNETDCPAQIEGVIEFFFKTLGNCDGFGPKIIEQLVGGGEKTVRSIYGMTRLGFTRCGIGGKTVNNLMTELEASRQRPIEDWRFLAAFSIHNVGKGGCERLLKHHRLSDIFTLTVEDIAAIPDFGLVKAKSLVSTLAKIRESFDYLMGLGFNLIETPLLGAESKQDNPISRKTVVFTGTMVSGKRLDMEKAAKLLGAKVSGSVSKNTDYLVCGANVGESKTKAAITNGTRVLSESDYLKLISQ